MVYYPGCRTRARFVKCRIKKITIITISYANTTINPPTFGFLKGAKIFDNSTNIEIGTVVNVIKRYTKSVTTGSPGAAGASTGYEFVEISIKPKNINYNLNPFPFSNGIVYTGLYPNNVRFNPAPILISGAGVPPAFFPLYQIKHTSI